MSDTLPMTEVLGLLGLEDDAARRTVEIVEIPGAEMPQPYRDLLVHERDMTRTLEAFCGEDIHLRPLDVERVGEELHRRVLLVSDDSATVVEFGAIRIHLRHLDAPCREAILEGWTPLGSILNEQAVGYTCRPRMYFRFRGAAALRGAFTVDGSTALYGRANTILDAAGRTLAEVVEILPVLAGDKS